MGNNINNLIKLIDACKTSSEPVDDLKVIERAINSFSRYMNIVAREPVVLSRIRIEYSDETGTIYDPLGYKEAVKDIDEERRVAHNIVVGLFSTLNKMCKEFEIEPFYDGDMNDRYAIGEYAASTVFKLYNINVSDKKHILEEIVEKNITIDNKLSLDDIIKLSELHKSGTASNPNLSDKHIDIYLDN